MLAHRLDSGDVVFHKALAGWKPGDRYHATEGANEILLPCGQCIGCRLERSRQWAMRCIHEAQLHKDNCFITLTYDAENLPPDCGLVKKDFQNFMKRLRKRFPKKKIKFYQCGEYGDRNNRPHYHAILFGHNFNDWLYLFDSPSGEPIYTSPTLEAIWNNGFVTIGTVTFESAGYVARYCLKKINGQQKDIIDETTGLKHYERINSFTGEIVEVLPEYSTMSRGGRTGRGIAHDWIKRYRQDCYPKDYTTIRGVRMRPAKYYDKYIQSIDPQLYDDIKAARNYEADISLDNSESRLSQRKKCVEAQNKNLKRII